MEVKDVRPSRRDSYERLCRDFGTSLLDLHGDQAVRSRLLDARLERFIGVIYRPETELVSHYAAASLPQQFDAWVWLDQTTAVVPRGPSMPGREYRRLGRSACDASVQSRCAPKSSIR